tara:strand:+ start:549 stop:1109 length:561 start_codon:yes stop_codon:yes gene_type:complete
MAITAGISAGDLPGTPSTLSADINVRQPSNTSYLHPTAFRFYIGRVPSVTYFCQAATLPSIDIASIERPNMFSDIKEVSGKPTYGDLTIRFLIDEDMENWRSIHDWMRDISAFEDFRDVIKPDSDHKSDVRLVILTNGMNPNVEVAFKDCWPSSLGAIEFDSAVADLENLTSEVTFAYDTYSIVKL